jgi:hypothetical protein
MEIECINGLNDRDYGMSTEDPPKPRGRRPYLPPEERKRESFTFRVRSALRAKIEDTATENGRSLSEEIEHRLERSVYLDDHVTPEKLHAARKAVDEVMEIKKNISEIVAGYEKLQSLNAYYDKKTPEVLLENRNAINKLQLTFNSYKENSHRYIKAFDYIIKTESNEEVKNAIIDCRSEMIASIEGSSNIKKEVEKLLLSNNEMFLKSTTPTD